MKEKVEKEKNQKEIIDKIEKTINDNEIKKEGTRKLPGGDTIGIDGKNTKSGDKDGAIDVKVVVEVKKPAGDKAAKTDVKINGKQAVISPDAPAEKS